MGLDECLNLDGKAIHSIKVDCDSANYFHSWVETIEREASHIIVDDSLVIHINEPNEDDDTGDDIVAIANDSDKELRLDLHWRLK